MLGGPTPGVSMRTSLLLFLALSGLQAQPPLAMKPKEALVPCGQTVQFRIPGQDPKAFRWQTDRGKVDESGLFTAPGEPGPCRVTAHEWQDINRSASADVRAVAIRLSSDPQLFLKPREEGRVRFQLEFKGGEMDRTLIWTFGPRAPGEDGEASQTPGHDGQVDATGWLRAPSAEGTYPITIALAADPRIHAITQLWVFRPHAGRVNLEGGPVEIQVQPAKSELAAGTYQNLSAVVTGSDIQQVIWRIMDGPKDAEVDSSGLFKASRQGTYRLRASSIAYPEVWGEAVVEVKPAMNGLLKEEEAPKEDRVGMTIVSTSPESFLIFGGWNGKAASTQVLRLDLEAQTLRPHLDLQVARARCLAARLTDGTLLVVGGIGRDGRSAVREAERVDPVRRVSWRVGMTWWHHIGGLLEPLPGGRALLVGGCEPDGQPCGVEAFDAESGTFKILDKRPWPAHAASVPLKGGQVLILGGELDRRPVALVWSFDPAKDAFTPVGRLAQARSRFTATLLWNDREVIVAGGRGSKGSLASVERIDVAKGTSSPGGRLAEPRERHAAVLIPTGQILLLGGGDGARASKLMEDWSPDENQTSLRDHLEAGVWLPFLSLKRDGGVFVNGLPEGALGKVPPPPVWTDWD